MLNCRNDSGIIREGFAKSRLAIGSVMPASRLPLSPAVARDGPALLKFCTHPPSLLTALLLDRSSAVTLQLSRS